MIVAVISEYLGNLSFVKPLCLPSLNVLKTWNIHLTSTIVVLLTSLTSSIFHILHTYINYTWSASSCAWCAFQKSGCFLVCSNSVIAAVKCIPLFSYYSNCYEHRRCILLLVSYTRVAVNTYCSLHFFQARNIWLSVYAAKGWLILNILCFLHSALWYNYVT